MNRHSPASEDLFSRRQGETALLRTAGLADASGFRVVPGSALVRTAGQGRLRVLASGRGAEVDRHPDAAKARVIDLTGSVVLPALINAHTHLDLTHVGPRPFDAPGGFVGWVDMVRRERLSDPDAIRRSVASGASKCLAGGVAAVGDIAGCPITGPQAVGAEMLFRSGLKGVSFVEFFGIGRGRERGLSRAMEAIHAASERILPDPSAPGIKLGLQPHAPNTVSLGEYERALRVRGRPLSTHVAETVEEREFIATGKGPQRELLERVGAWEDSILDDVGRGRTPVGHLASVLGGDAGRSHGEPILLVHVNDCGDEDLETLATLRRSGIGLNVVYCPRASAYFRVAETFGPHRYLDMLQRGIPVALGTDSVINLSEDDLAHGLSTWGEIQMLHARDGTDSTVLLAMATTLAAAALGLSPHEYLLANPGPKAGLIAVSTGDVRPGDNPIEAAIVSGNPVQFLFNNNESGLTET